jgi:small subunit ribosomal protein S16
MAVMIRLARQGTKKKPFYRIVATDKRSPRDGRFIEQIGYFDPRKPDFKLDQARYQHWVDHGALPSDTLASLARRSAQSAQNAQSPQSSKAART